MYGLKSRRGVCVWGVGEVRSIKIKLITKRLQFSCFYFLSWAVLFVSKKKCTGDRSVKTFLTTLSYFESQRSHSSDSFRTDHMGPHIKLAHFQNCVNAKPPLTCKFHKVEWITLFL